MPINDAYSPVAHWQWLATLWRGCAGPDVTVVIKGTGDADDVSPPPNGAGPGAEAGRPTVAPGVEVRLLDCRAVVVRTNLAGNANANANANGNGSGNGKNKHNGKGDTTRNREGVDAEIWEKAKRRVGFEVEEFLRR